MSIRTYFHGGAFGTFGWVDTSKKLTAVFMVQTADPASDPSRDAFVQMASASCDQESKTASYSYD